MEKLSPDVSDCNEKSSLINTSLQLNKYRISLQLNKYRINASLQINKYSDLGTSVQGVVPETF